MLVVVYLIFVAVWYCYSCNLHHFIASKILKIKINEDFEHKNKVFVVLMWRPSILHYHNCIFLISQNQQPQWEINLKCPSPLWLEAMLINAATETIRHLQFSQYRIIKLFHQLLTWHKSVLWWQILDIFTVNVIFVWTEFMLMWLFFGQKCHISSNYLSQIININISKSIWCLNLDVFNNNRAKNTVSEVVSWLTG